MEPAQYVPLMPMSTRPRYFAGIISSMAELIAAYSPPMPAPAMKRVRYRNARPVAAPFHVSAVSALPPR